MAVAQLGNDFWTAIRPFGGYFATFPPNPASFRTRAISASSYRSVSAVNVACLRSKFTCTFFAHGKVASASRTRGGQPIAQVRPVTSTVTSLVPAAGSPFWSACFWQPLDVASAINTSTKTTIAKVERSDIIDLLKGTSCRRSSRVVRRAAHWQLVGDKAITAACARARAFRVTRIKGWRNRVARNRTRLLFSSNQMGEGQIVKRWSVVTRSVGGGNQ